ncbi:MAG: US12 family protein [Planctomycetes bacterium]|nr:US12 family protein [Planctomycetota bacterium]
MAQTIGALDFDQRFAALDDAKAAFVSKVYGLLCVSLIASTLTCAFTVANMATMRGFANWAGLLALGLLLIGMFVRLSGPLGYVFLFGFVSLIGVSLGPLIDHYLKTPDGTNTVGLALGLTAGIFLGLTAYVRISGKNFSYLFGFLWIATIGMMLAGLALMFFGGPMSRYIYSWIGAALFCGWILYDTSAVTREYYQSNNVVGAVLNLFLDIVNLFLYILSILSNSRSRD